MLLLIIWVRSRGLPTEPSLYTYSVPTFALAINTGGKQQQSHHQINGVLNFGLVPQSTWHLISFQSPPKLPHAFCTGFIARVNLWSLFLEECAAANASAKFSFSFFYFAFNPDSVKVMFKSIQLIFQQRLVRNWAQILHASNASTSCWSICVWVREHIKNSGHF